jgi:hypothetical protein
VIGVISLIPISHGPTTTTISIAHHLATSRSCGKRYDHRLILCYNILFILFARLVVLITFLAVLSILSRTCVPWLLKLMISLSSQVWLLVFHKMLKMGTHIHTFLQDFWTYLCMSYLSYFDLFYNYSFFLCRPMNYINWHQLHSACL